jgi:hypothetical protein
MGMYSKLVEEMTRFKIAQKYRSVPVLFPFI